MPRSRASATSLTPSAQLTGTVTLNGNGNVWTPTTLPRLAEIWKAKNLPMD